MYDKEFTEGDIEFARAFTDAMEELYERNRSYEWEENPEQMKRFKRLIKYIKLKGGTITAIEHEPEKIHGGVTAVFTLLSANGREEVHKLLSVLNGASAVEFFAQTDGKIGISATVPDIYRIKE